MARFIENRDGKLWTAPGTPSFVGKVHIEDPTVEDIQYTPESIDRIQNTFEKWVPKARDTEGVEWVNIVGLHKVEALKNYMEQMELHALTVEDILNTTQRPKFEEHRNYLLLILKMIYLTEDKKFIESEQVSLVLHKDGLLTLQERPKDVFGPVRERLVRSTTKIRHRGADYLAFALLDTILDHYYQVVEVLGESIEDHEDVILKDPKESDRAQINTYKQQINLLRKYIRPLREVILQLKKSEAEFIQTETRPYFKELDDNLNSVLDAIEFYKEQLNDLLAMFNSKQDQRLNEIMRLLTVFSVVFIPLTFIAGIYGTNFKYLPELEYRWSYPVFWVVLLLIAGGMIYYFKRKKWF